MYNTGSNYFPSQVVSDIEKISLEYGLKIANAIEIEWFDKSYNGKYYHNINRFHELRLYARGEQNIQKYKDELSINGDLSYLNLDWKPVPIIPKFVDIVVNGIAERGYKVNAYSQDPFGVAKRTEYMNVMLSDMLTKDLAKTAKDVFGVNISENPIEELPETKEELDLHMQLTYKQNVEIAEESAISTLLEGNRFELTRKRFYRDLAVIGIGCVKTGFNPSQGVTVDYVDPADIVYSYTESPYFEDIYYVGEVKEIPINELVREFPFLTTEDLKEIKKTKSSKYSSARGNTRYNMPTTDENKVQVLYFNYKTYMNEVYKIKKTASGAEKAIEKDDSFQPPPGIEGRFDKMERAVEVLFEGAKIVGGDRMLRWEPAKNQMRPKSDYTKVKMNYQIVAPRMYKGKIESLVSRVTTFADMIQLTHLKLQQVMSRMMPDGVYLDADGLAEIDLGNGTNYNPQEALNMFFQTGSIIGRSFTSEGDMNPGKIPIQEIQSNSGSNKLQSLITTYNYYLQMIRDVTGLNEAKDGSTPDKNALVGVQKLAAANSNTATRHILQAGMFLTAEVCEALSLRISDILEYSPTKDAFIQAIGNHNVATLKEIEELHLYDFGIFLELEPDEEEKQMLENNIQVALSQGSLDLEDAIDVRNIKNVKLANQLLKIRRKKKMQQDQAAQQANIQAQAQANSLAQQSAAQAETTKALQIQEGEMNLEKLKAQLKLQTMQQEAEIKKALVEHAHQYNMDLKQAEMSVRSNADNFREDRKDKRTKIQATQQSELINQRQTGTAPKNFEETSDNMLRSILGENI